MERPFLFIIDWNEELVRVSCVKAYSMAQINSKKYKLDHTELLGWVGVGLGLESVFKNAAKIATPVRPYRHTRLHSSFVWLGN